MSSYLDVILNVRLSFKQQISKNASAIQVIKLDIKVYAIKSLQKCLQ